MANTIEELEGRRHFDYIVIGCGGIGSGAVYWLSKRPGCSVLGLERYKLGHVNGGSQDVSRIIRLSYDGDRYMNLTPHTYTAWAEVERESGMQLVYKPGSLNLTTTSSGPSYLEFMRYADTLAKNNIPHEIWNNEQIKAKYPQFTIGPEYIGIWQKDGGLVDAALGNTLHISLAQGRGAKVLDNCPVKRISRNSAGILEVSTPKGIFTCKKVIVSAGAWINDVLASVGCHVPVYVTEENVTYFASPHIKEFTRDNFPIFLAHTPEGHFYGLPAHVIGGTKIGIDAGGHVVSGDRRSFTPDPARLDLIKNFLRNVLPKFLGPVLETKVCLYTMTPDRDFLIDTCQKSGFPDVVVCCGAGHAFKFASLLGKILTELAVDGNTQYNIDAFTWDREALTNPNFEPTCFRGRKITSNL